MLVSVFPRVKTRKLFGSLSVVAFKLKAILPKERFVLSARTSGISSKVCAEFNCYWSYILFIACIRIFG